MQEPKGEPEGLSVETKDVVSDAAFPPVERSESFLARYPRKIKVAVALGALLILVSPLFVRGFLLSQHGAGPQTRNATIQNQTLPAGIHGIENSTSKEDKVLTSADHRADGPVALNDQDDATVKLASAPDPQFSDEAADGVLPRIAEDGRLPWQFYSRPYNRQDTRPRIAIVIADLGLARVATDAAINRLPRNVTLAFDVQSPVVGAWCARARQAGHEVLLNIPMEPFDYPRSDPGPHTLLTTLSNVDNLDRLNWALRQASGYVGVTTFSGSRFTTDSQKLLPVVNVLKARGLIVFDARIAPYTVLANLAHEQQVPFAASTGRLDRNLTPEAIDRTLSQLEQMAQLNGHAIAVVSPLPIILDHLEIWMKGLPQRGISLAPISAMVE